MRKAFFVIAAVSTAGLIAAIATAAVQGPFLIKGGDPNQQNPAATADWFAWTQAPADHPNRTTVWAEDAETIDGTDAFRINDTGRAWTGGIDGNTLVYQRISSGNSNVRLYDLFTREPIPLPAAANTAINTSNWEWHPTISTETTDDGDQWILFGRQSLSTGAQRVIAYNVDDDTRRVLASTSRRSYALYPGQVNGDWATWTSCMPNCQVWFANLVAGTPAVRVPRPSSVTHQYGSSIMDDGTVYFVRSGRGCGANVGIGRYQGGVRTILEELPDRRDIFFTYLWEEAPNARHVYYDQVNCGSGAWNILEVVDDGT